MMEARTTGESSYSSGLSSAEESLPSSYYGYDQEEDSSSTDLDLSGDHDRLKTKTLFDDVKVILRKHDKKLSQMEDNVSMMVRWLNEKFGFVLTCESSSFILSCSDDANDITGSPSPDEPPSHDKTLPARKRDFTTNSQSPLRESPPIREDDCSMRTSTVESAQVKSESLKKLQCPVSTAPRGTPNLAVFLMKPPPPSSAPKSTSAVPQKPSTSRRRRRAKDSSKSFPSGHDPQLPSQCDTCGKFLKDPSTLRQHKQIHLNIRPFPCSHPNCGKSFRRKFHLQTHLLIHQGIKKHQCGYCGRLFLLPKDLVSHERIHTGERPFHCSECSKSFSLKSHLVMHLRTHTGEKPYKCCDVCSKYFAQSNSLRLHKKKVHQDFSNSATSNIVKKEKTKKGRREASSTKGKQARRTPEDNLATQGSLPKVPIFRYRAALVNAIAPSAILLEQPHILSAQPQQSYEFSDISIPISTDQIVFQQTSSQLQQLSTESTQSVDDTHVSSHYI